MVRRVDPSTTANEFHRTPVKEPSPRTLPITHSLLLRERTSPITHSPVHRDISICFKQYLTRLQLMGEQEDDNSSDCSNGTDPGGWCNEETRSEVYEPEDKNLPPWTDTKNPFTVITFDQATHEAWEIAKEEMKIVRKNVMEKLRLKAISSFRIEALYNFITGPSSSLWRIIEINLNDGKLYSTDAPLTHSVFDKILKTFFVASSFKSSTDSLFNNSFIDKSYLCSQKEYLQFWNAVSKKDSDRYDPSHIYLWQRVMDEVNSLCRDLFLSNWPPYIKKHVTLDDDKNHYNGKMGWYDTAGLKPTQFVRDNRRGFVFHTMVFTTSGIPLGLEAELVSDSSSLDTSTRLVIQQLAPSHRSRFQIPNLSNNVFFADRAYWVRKFLYEFVLPSGGEVGPSTHKKDHEFPFTFDQKLTRNDTRELIQTKGGKCIKLKHRQIGPHSLCAVAYRDGNGKVVLGISSSSDVYYTKHWDFHLFHPEDRYKLLDEDSGWSHRLDTWVHNLDGGQLSETFVDLVRSTSHVKAMTTEGSEDSAWFLARAFSLTSSTTDKIVCVAEEVIRRNGGQDNEFISNLNVILDYLGKTPLQLSLPNLTVDDETNSERSDEDTREIEQEDSIVEGTNLSALVRSVNEDRFDFDSFQESLRIISSESVKAFLQLIGGDAVKSRAKNIEKITEWLNVPMLKRKYWFMKKEQLVNTCVLELKGSKSSYLTKSRPALIDLLAEPRVVPPAPNEVSEEAQRPSRDVVLQEALVKQILSSSVLKPLSGTNRQSCRIGLDNEVALLSRLLEDSRKLEVLFPTEQNTTMHMIVSEIYRPGMVRKVGKEYVKSSIDALGVLLGAGDGVDPQLVGIEVKTRTEETTRKPELAMRSNLQRGEKFVMIDYNKAKRFILSNHECVQILHHAFVYDLKLVLLLIGDKKGTILRGVWVGFDETILTAYGEFLDRCYNESLKWAYHDLHEEGDVFHEEDSLNLIKPFLPKEVDFESFADFFNLWKNAVHGDDEHLPIPPTKTIVPFHFAKWNKFKGGSDTMTKLFWNTKHYVPSASPSSNAVSQLFRFLAVTMYRVDAVMNCKEDLNSYESLYAWRKANRARQSSFEKFLRDLVEAASKQSSVLHNPSSLLSVDLNSRSTRFRVNQVEVQWGSEQTFHTPARKASSAYSRTSSIDEIVLQRREECTGQIVFRVGLDANQKPITEGPGCRARCVVCHQLTRHYCTSCRHWICGPSKANVDPITKKETLAFITQSDGNRIYFRRSCWHLWHEKGLSCYHSDGMSLISEISE